MGKPKQTEKRRWKTKPLSGLLPPSVNKALRRFGFAQTSIVSNWAKIVGSEMSLHTSPTKLTFKRGTRDNGTLHVMVDGAQALKFQHLLPLTIEKINMFHGFKLVGHIAITQGPVASRNEEKIRAQNKPLPVLDESEQSRLDEMLEDTQSDSLKQVLSNLGRRVLGDKKT
ncbi:MAG: DUF721 domain-containing protein [Sphingomonadales bacterium]|nr:DUF721 domain-containing protein [Sphingomonadales bacterium]